MNLQKTGLVLLALLLAAMTMVPLVSAADEEQNSDQKLDEPDPVPLDEKAQKEMQKQIIMDLQASTLIDAKEKALLIKQLKEIWSGKRPMMESEKNKILSRVFTVLLDTYNQSPSIKWVGCTNIGCDAAHNDMARVAGEKMGIDSDYSTILYDNAGVPDTWGYSVDHYAISGAPGNVEYWADEAQPLITGSDPELGYTYLAYAMHFMSDMSVPFHTSPVYLSQHATYENYVDNNWNSGEEFVDVINGNNYYYYISDPSASATNMASYSNGYQSYIVSAMANSGWESDPNLIQYTKDCLLAGQRYNMGLIDYATSE